MKLGDRVTATDGPHKGQSGFVCHIHNGGWATIAADKGDDFDLHESCFRNDSIMQPLIDQANNQQWEWHRRISAYIDDLLLAVSSAMREGIPTMTLMQIIEDVITHHGMSLNMARLRVYNRMDVLSDSDPVNVN
jgi:hypothetical protein